ncbi:MAG TPA: hypothetical protein PLV68_16925, partial [Ilumatobacteraceae bacterium]|nr:hypothetical protein [Ilumatobacteraceae bacterium]
MSTDAIDVIDAPADAGVVPSGRPATVPVGAPVASLRIVSRKRPARWIATAVIAVLVAMLVNGLVTNPKWDWPVFFEYFTADSILKALRTTLWLTLWGTVVGFGQYSQSIFDYHP